MFFLKTCFRSSIKGNNITRCFKDNSKSCVNQDHLAIQWNDTLKSVTNLCNESEYCLKYCKKIKKKKTTLTYFIIVHINLCNESEYCLKYCKINFKKPTLTYFIIVFKYTFSRLIYIFLFCSL